MIAVEYPYLAALYKTAFSLVNIIKLSSALFMLSSFDNLSPLNN